MMFLDSLAKSIIDFGVDGVDDPVPGEDVQLCHLGLAAAGAHHYALTRGSTLD